MDVKQGRWMGAVDGKHSVSDPLHISMRCIFRGRIWQPMPSPPCSCYAIASQETALLDTFGAQVHAAMLRMRTHLGP